MMMTHNFYFSFKPGSTTTEAEAINIMQKCIGDIQDWIFKNKLKMNDGKT